MGAESITEHRRYDPHEVVLLATFVVIAVLGRIVYVITNDLYYDDAYITFRYARNLIEGHGLVYQTGERVYGASSPLYAFICAGLYAVVGEAFLPSVARWLGTIGIILFSLTVAGVFPRRSPARALTLIALLAYPRIFYASIGGMEECLIMAAMGLSVWAAMRRRWGLTGFACGILLFMKADAILWCTCIFIALAFAEGRIPWQAIVISLLVILPWGVFSELYYGSLLPHSMEAKRIAFATTSKVTVSDLMTLTVPDPFKRNSWMTAGMSIFTLAAIGGSLVLVVRRRLWVLLVFPLYCIGYILALFISGTSAGLWARWTVPMWGALFVCAGICLDGLRAPWLRAQFQSMGSWQRSVLIVLLCGLLVIPCTYVNREKLVVESFRQVGNWLKERGTPNADVLVEPIGMIGYLSSARIHDFIGLVSPDITAKRAEFFSDEWFMRYVEENQPSYVIIRQLELESNQFLYGGYGDGIFSSAGRKKFFESHHEVFRTYEGPVSDRLVVFSR